MLGDMRFTVHLPDEDERPLHTLANLGLRGFKEQAAYYLHLKIREEYAKLSKDETLDNVEAAA